MAKGDKGESVRERARAVAHNHSFSTSHARNSGVVAQGGVESCMPRPQRPVRDRPEGF